MKKNILLVDDDEVLNYVNRKMLEHAGIASEIDTALSCKHGLDLLNNYLNMDGFTFLEAFKRIKVPDGKRISIVIVTSSSDPADIARAKSLGIKTFLTKPISQEDIMRALSDN